MKKSVLSVLLVVVLLATLLVVPGSAEGVTFPTLQPIVSKLKVGGSGTTRDVALAGAGRYALVLLSDTPSTVAKIDLLTKEVVATKAINLSGVKGIEVDETQNVYFVSTVAPTATSSEVTQNIYVYSVTTMDQVGVITYTTPANKGKKSDLYNISLKKLGGRTYLYAVHQGTGWHAAYPQYAKDDVLCRLDVTDYASAALDTSFGTNGFLYLEDMISDGDPACLFDVAVQDDGSMLVARQSDNNDKISLFLVDANGSVLKSKFIKYAKYVELVDDYAIVSLTGGKAITVVDPATLEPVSGVLPASLPNQKYAGVTYDANNKILYLVSDSDNILFATGDYTQAPIPTATPDPTATPAPTTAPAPTPLPGGNGIPGYFPYAYFYGYGTGDAGADDAIKREEASALLYRILKQQGLTDGFVATTASYGDVSTSNWAFQAIEYMKSIGVFDPADNLFPLRPITRGEIAKMIALALDYGADGSTTVAFTDLTTDSPNYAYIKAMADNGIYQGNGDQTINPDGMMTRGEFVTTINRLLGRDARSFDLSGAPTLFPDLSTGHWAYADIMLATNGFSDVANEGGKYTIDPAKKPDRATIDYN